MKKSEFIKKVLSSCDNTIFTTVEQVEVALEVFEGLGMLPPNQYLSNEPDYSWEEE